MWMGKYQDCKVAVKVPRAYSARNLAKITKVGHHQKFAESAREELITAQVFCRQVILWKRLRHPNVLQLLGVTTNGGRFAMVSEWMTNGTINEYVKTHKSANRFELVGFVPSVDCTRH